MDSSSFITKGSIVEVTSDDNGPWFVATVLHPPPPYPSPNNLVYVEYHNLLTSDSSSRLREYANVSYIRPSPPPSVGTTFEANDLVELFHKDGWWTGYVHSVVDASNYLVIVNNPTQQVSANIKDLRLHMKWVNGIWVQPHKQSTAGLMFTVGKKVEVSFDKESLRDVWFPATVLKNSGNNTFLVEYQQPGSGDEAVLHKVTVDYLHIRPSPPHLRDKNFVLLEKVDAYYDYGWWSGVITKELADNRYNVFFKHTKKEKEFVCSKVRPHIEWKGGKWFNTSQGDMDGNATRSLIDKQIEQTTPNNGKQSTVETSIMTRTKQINLDSNDKCSLPSKKLKNDTILDDSSKKTNGTSASQSEGLESEFGKTENLSHGKKVRSKRGKGIEQKTPTTESSKKRGRLADEVKSLNLEEGAKDDSVETNTQGIVEKDVTKDLALPVVVGLHSNEMTVSQGKIIPKASAEIIPSVAEGDTKEPDVPLVPLAVVDKDGKEEDAATIAPKRKRGRPPRFQAKSPKTPIMENNQNEGVDPSIDYVVEIAQTKEVSLPTSSGAESLEKNQEPVKQDNQQIENTKQDLNVQRSKKKYSSGRGKRGKRRTISINSEAPAQVGVDSQYVSKEKADENLETINQEASGGKSLDTVSDDQPLSRWIEGMHSPITTINAASERRMEIVPCNMNSDNLPFVKSTPLWHTIESMEAFQKIPQNPHFRPLLQGVKESAREGIAIGSMVTFTTVVDRTYCLRFDDPRSSIEDSLETLVELESNGFDVEVIRDRLTGLLLLKDKQEELEERSKGVVEKIEKHKIQEKVIDDEVDEFDRQIRELEEKRRQVLLKKEKWTLEIEAMKAAEEALEQEIREVATEFDGLAAAPW